MPGAEAGRRVLEALRDRRAAEARAVGRLGPDHPVEVGERFAAAIGRRAAEKIEGASHFLQEDEGEEIGERIAEWIQL